MVDHQRDPAQTAPSMFRLICSLTQLMETTVATEKHAQGQHMPTSPVYTLSSSESSFMSKNLHILDEQMKVISTTPTASDRTMTTTEQQQLLSALAVSINTLLHVSAGYGLHHHLGLALAEAGAQKSNLNATEGNGGEGPESS